MNERKSLPEIPCKSSDYTDLEKWLIVAASQLQKRGEPHNGVGTEIRIHDYISIQRETYHPLIKMHGFSIPFSIERLKELLWATTRQTLDAQLQQLVDTIYVNNSTWSIPTE